MINKKEKTKNPRIKTMISLDKPISLRPYQDQEIAVLMYIPPDSSQESIEKLLPYAKTLFDPYHVIEHYPNGQLKLLVGMGLLDNNDGVLYRGCPGKPVRMPIAEEFIIGVAPMDGSTFEEEREKLKLGQRICTYCRYRQKKPCTLDPVFFFGIDMHIGKSIIIFDRTILYL